MKKVKVLFSAFALVALVAGVFAAKAHAEDVIYKYNPDTNVCDIAIQFTTQLNGAVQGSDDVTLIQGTPRGVGLCSFQAYYHVL